MCWFFILISTNYHILNDIYNNIIIAEHNAFQFTQPFSLVYCRKLQNDGLKLAKNQKFNIHEISQVAKADINNYT